MLALILLIAESARVRNSHGKAVGRVSRQQVKAVLEAVARLDEDHLR